MATDLADYLVGKGIPFRETHALAGKAVRMAAEKNQRLEEMPLAAYQSLCPAFEADVFQVFDSLKSIQKRKSVGGASLQAVKAQINGVKRLLSFGKS